MASVDLSPPAMPITVQQGSSGTIRFTFPFDATGWAAGLQVREQPDAPGDPLVDLSTTGGGLSWTSVGASSVLLLTFVADTFTDVATGIWAYDLKLTPVDATLAKAYVKGSFTIKGQVTQ